MRGSETREGLLYDIWIMEDTEHRVQPCWSHPPLLYATDSFSSVGREGRRGVRGYELTCQHAWRCDVDAKLPMGVSAEPSPALAKSAPSLLLTVGA
jgi:hypothetical protein